MRILLIRHGPSSHLKIRGLLDRAAVDRWRSDYDAAGISPGATPPPTLAANVVRADVVATSDLPRAIASAALLCPDKAVTTSPLFREVPLAIPDLSHLRAPLAVWNLLIALRWGLDILRGRDRPPPVRQRVQAAAQWCRTTCQQHGTDARCVIITHGVVRRLLARQLIEDGWNLLGRKQSYAHWSVWELMDEAAESTRGLANTRWS